MTEHIDLPFIKLHNALFESSVVADLPIAPEGNGDTYYAEDTQTLYVGFVAEDSFSSGFSSGFAQQNSYEWRAYDLDNLNHLPTSLTDLSDVSAATSASNRVLAAGDGATGGDYRGRALVSDDIPVLDVSKFTSAFFSLSIGSFFNGAWAASYGFRGSGGASLGALITGADTYVLTANSINVDGVSWIAPPATGLPSLIGAKANRTSGTLSGTLSWNNDLFDTDTIHDPVTDNSRFTCFTAGYYYICCYLAGTINLGGAFGNYIALNKNGSLSPTVLAENGFMAHTILYLDVADYITFQVTTITVTTPNGEASAAYIWKLG